MVLGFKVEIGRKQGLSGANICYPLAPPSMMEQVYFSDEETQGRWWVFLHIRASLCSLACFPGGLQKIVPVEGIGVIVICGFFEVPSNLRLYPE